MTSQTVRFRNQVKAYLKQNAIPYVESEIGIQLIVARSNSNYHYLSIAFNDVPEEWFIKKKPFKFYKLMAISFEQVVTAINKYLKA